MPVFCRFWWIAAAMALVTPPKNVVAQADRRSFELIENLLALPAAPPDWREHARERNEGLPNSERDWFEGPPPNDAAIDILTEYWAYRCKWPCYDAEPPDPPRAVRRQLLSDVLSDKDACLPPGLLDCLPAEPDTYAEIGRIVADHEERSGKPGHESEPGRWLMLTTSYFRTELVEAVSETSFRRVAHEEELRALATLDWATAEPLLLGHAAGEDSRLAALANAILYEHAVEAVEGEATSVLRVTLKSIVEDPGQAGFARNCAFDALFLDEWSGRDEWFLSLFADETIFALHEESSIYVPLRRPVRADPDKWIPRIIPLVGHPDRNVHNAAVLCLMEFSVDSGHCREDALVPLLPFLTDPNWARAPYWPYQLRLTQTMASVDLPQSVPHLLMLAERATEHELEAAATALAHYGALEGIALLKQALEREEGEYHRRKIIRAIYDLGGFSDDEIATFVEAYARRSITKEARERVEYSALYPGGAETPLSVDVVIAVNLSRMETVREGAIEKLCARSRSLLGSEPKVARRIGELLAGWNSPAGDQYLVEQIARGIASADTIRAALDRREQVRAHVDRRLRGLAFGRGAVAGIAAALLTDPLVSKDLLTGHDRVAQAAFLACARLTYTEYAVEPIAAFVQRGDGLLHRSAEMYLRSQYRPEARALVYDLYPREAVVLGYALPDVDSYCRREGYDQFEKELRQEILNAGDLQELYALDDSSTYARYVMRIYDDTATFSRSSSGVSRYRDLSASELTEFLFFVDDNEVDYLPPVPVRTISHTCPSEYLHLSKSGGARVCFCSAEGPGAVYSRLAREFTKLAATGTFETRYYLSGRADGLEPLFFDEETYLLTVWQRDGDLRVLVHNDESTDNKGSAWRSVVDGQLGPLIPQPEECPMVPAPHEVPDGLGFNTRLRTSAWEARVGSHTVRSLKRDGERGLWLCRAGAIPRPLLMGRYVLPIATSDERQIVAGHTEGTGRASVNSIVIIDTASHRVRETDVPEANRCVPVAFVAGHDAVLIRRSRHYARDQSDAVGPEKPEYRLLDPGTGLSRVVNGEFWPLEGQSRPLQPTDRPNEYWAARSDHDETYTEVGRYNAKSFIFTPTMTIPNVTFRSMEMWVAEAEGWLYFVGGGDLLRYPIAENTDGR